MKERTSNATGQTREPVTGDSLVVWWIAFEDRHQYAGGRMFWNTKLDDCVLIELRDREAELCPI